MAKTLHSFDYLVLSRYLEKYVPGFAGLKKMTKFSDGQSNPTYKVIDNADVAFVLRAKPPGTLLKSAHAVDREFRVMSALAKTQVPVPNMLHLSESESPLGAQFFVMDFLPGTVFWNPALPGRSNDFRSQIYRSMVKTLATLHDINPSKVNLDTFGKPGNYFERQVNRWSTQYRASETQLNSDMDWTIDWLKANLVADDGQLSIVHGDYRLDNVMFEKEAGGLIAVLDWELSTLGHPFADLAFQCMGLRLPQTALTKGLGNLDRAAIGIPSEADYVSEYCALRSISLPENWPFYMAFSFFRLAAILQGVLYRAQSGNASNPAGLDIMKSAVKDLAEAAKNATRGK